MPRHGVLTQFFQRRQLEAVCARRQSVILTMRYRIDPQRIATARPTSAPTRFIGICIIVAPREFQ